MCVSRLLVLLSLLVLFILETVQMIIKTNYIHSVSMKSAMHIMKMHFKLLLSVRIRGTADQTMQRVVISAVVVCRLLFEITSSRVIMCDHMLYHLGL